MSNAVISPRLVLFGKIAVFAAGAVICNYLDIQQPHVAQYLVGAIFGIVVLVWHARSLPDLIDWRSAAFVAASAAIYFVVKLLPGHTLGEIDTLSEIMERFWSILVDGIKLFGGVLVNSITLPVAHALLLGASLKRTLIAIPFILGIWFKVSLLWLALIIALPGQEPPALLTYTINFTSIWQLAYLASMFAFRSRGVGKQHLASAVPDKMAA
ncbi:MAG: hypothetical protein JSW54_08075 [Fidelibacterota bacterium]|nr:MAG: hypothetical protein JSW54_08075 [Candidatus Neomarinimicrobiota bacterium]